MSSLLSPILDVIAEIIIPELVTVACTIGKEKSEEKKEQKAELKKAMEADRSEISDELYSDIKRISRDSFIMQSIFLSIACRTNKIIKYATYYLTTDTAKKISCDVGDKELINAIAEKKSA